MLTRLHRVAIRVAKMNVLLLAHHARTFMASPTQKPTLDWMILPALDGPLVIFFMPDLGNPIGILYFLMI